MLIQESPIQNSVSNFTVKELNFFSMCLRQVFQRNCMINRSRKSEPQRDREVGKNQTKKKPGKGVGMVRAEIFLGKQITGHSKK